MKFLKWLLGIVVALGIVLFVVGWLLPSTFTVQRSASVNAPADKVYALVAAPKAWRQWSVWTQRDAAMQIDYTGPEAGAGAGWSWKSRSEGDGRMTFTAAEPAKRLAYELFFPDFGTTSTGEFTFAPEGAGTRVTWTMNGDMGRSPLLHWMGLMMDSMVGKDFEGGLANLKAQAEKP